MTSVCHFCLQVLRNILAKQGSGSDRIELRCRRHVIGIDVRDTRQKQNADSIIKCRCSSVVEHVIGNDGVVSPILISGTINKNPTDKVGFLLMHIDGKKNGFIFRDTVAYNDIWDSENNLKTYYHLFYSLSTREFLLDTSDIAYFQSVYNTVLMFH